MRRFINILIILMAANMLTAPSMPVAKAVMLAAFIFVNISPVKNDAPTKRIWHLSAGAELLRLFMISAAASIVIYVLSVAAGGFDRKWLYLAVIVCTEAIVFWNGMIRVYLTSVQLGIKHRVLAALCGWIPVLNIMYLRKIICIASEEAEFETEKAERDSLRAESEICKTKYPILLVHGVFFRDFRYLNYWGRIPNALIKNGAQIYYGNQQSALSVEDSGRELAERIRQIAEETGCEKVNIIAHSKGGLDSREAISKFGAEKYVATLTTVNTPHRGCIFAEYLLGKIPNNMRQRIADTYNAAAKHLGDTEPDFLAAVTDLTESACKKRNEETKDKEGIVYESVASYCKKAQHGRFPLNMTYNIVKYFDGQNDGLVSVESAKWGSQFTLVEPIGKRGVSHGDMIDLNRENIKGFDVREFYVKLAAGLKNRGF